MASGVGTGNAWGDSDDILTPSAMRSVFGQAATISLLTLEKLFAGLLVPLDPGFSSSIRPPTSARVSRSPGGLVMVDGRPESGGDSAVIQLRLVRAARWIAKSRRPDGRRALGGGYFNRPVMAVVAHGTWFTDVDEFCQYVLSTSSAGYVQVPGHLLQGVVLLGSVSPGANGDAAPVYHCNASGCRRGAAYRGGLGDLGGRAGGDSPMDDPNFPGLGQDAVPSRQHHHHCRSSSSAVSSWHCSSLPLRRREQTRPDTRGPPQRQDGSGNQRENGGGKAGPEKSEYFHDLRARVHQGPRERRAG